MNLKGLYSVPNEKQTNECAAHRENGCSRGRICEFRGIDLVFRIVPELPFQKKKEKKTSLFTQFLSFWCLGWMCVCQTDDLSPKTCGTHCGFFFFFFFVLSDKDKGCHSLHRYMACAHLYVCEIWKRCKFDNTLHIRPHISNILILS